MVKRVIQTSPDIGLTIRLPRRQTVVQQAAPQTVAAAPGVPVWLGWQGEGGEAVARILYPIYWRDPYDMNGFPEWPYPYVWLAGVPLKDNPARVAQNITWTVRARVRLRIIYYESTEGGLCEASEGIPMPLLTGEQVDRLAITLLEQEIELSTTPDLWPEFPWRTDLNNKEVFPVVNKSAFCNWTAPPEIFPFVPPAAPAPNGRQWLEVPCNTLPEEDIAMKFFLSADENADAVYRFSLPAIWSVPGSGVLLVSTAASACLPDDFLDVELFATAHDADGKELGTVSLLLPRSMALLGGFWEITR